jgi:uncharacterized protein (DUF952 family)
MNSPAAPGWIVHLCPQTAWLASLSVGEYRPASLDLEGFIHCSRPEQVTAVANRFYRGLTGLVLLWIDPRQVTAKICWEPADGQIFPHIYGPLNITAVLAVRTFDPGPDGAFYQPAGL